MRVELFCPLIQSVSLEYSSQYLPLLLAYLLRHQDSQKLWEENWCNQGQLDMRDILVDKLYIENQVRKLKIICSFR